MLASTKESHSQAPFPPSGSGGSRTREMLELQRVVLQHPTRNLSNASPTHRVTYALEEVKGGNSK
jgi:hypothetical protein